MLVKALSGYWYNLEACLEKSLCCFVPQEAVLLFKFESNYQIFIYKALFMKMKCNTMRTECARIFGFCLFLGFFANVWTLITRNPPSRLTLSFNCIHTSGSVPPDFSPFSSDVSPRLPKSCRPNLRRKKQTNWLILNPFFQVSNPL